MRLLRRPQRYCRDCGHRMTRKAAYGPGGSRYSSSTGDRILVWYWCCPDAFFGFSREPWHDAQRIGESGARARLRARHY